MGSDGNDVCEAVTEFDLQRHTHTHVRFNGLQCIMRYCTQWKAVLQKTDRFKCFYRAMRMHSANYAVARCPSFCLSHAGIESKRLYISSKFFSPSGSPTILVFPYQTGCQYSDGDPTKGGVERKGVWKNHDFRPMSGFISELLQDRAIVTIESE